MKKSVKLIAALLLASMLLSSAAACSQDSGTQTETTAAADETTTQAAETGPKIDEYGREIVECELPDNLDYKGMEVRFIVRDNPKYSIDFAVDGQNGEIVNDTVYDRNRAVEEELNVVIKNHKVADDSTSVQDAIITTVTAGDNAYDVGAFYQFYAGNIATSGAMYNLLDINTIDSEKPWWSEEFFTELEYNGKIFLSAGSMNLSVTSMLMGIAFNQKKVIDYYDDYKFLYDEVYDGKWVFDRMTELSKDVYSDLNGNSTVDEGDFFGMATVEDNHGSWVTHFNIRSVTKDNSGVPQLTLFNEKTVNAYNKLYQYYRQSEGVYFAKKGFDQAKYFAGGNALFTNCTFYDSETTLRDMEDPYGILPMPKYDEAQDGYKNVAHDNSNLIGVVSNTKDPEAVGAVLELMNYYSYLDLEPAYFEVAMKQKYLMDSDSAKMFDLIVDGIMADFGCQYSLMLSGGKYNLRTIYYGSVRNNLRIDNPDYVSAYTANEDLYKTSLASFLSALDAVK